MTTKKTPTVAEHEAECDQVKKAIDNANVLVKRLTSELRDARDTLEMLKPAQHELIKLDIKYRSRFPERKIGWSAPEIVQTQIDLIDKALGDRK